MVAHAPQEYAMFEPGVLQRTDRVFIAVRRSSLYSKTMVVMVGLSAPAYFNIGHDAPLDFPRHNCS
jgi:hypothetical protein